MLTGGIGCSECCQLLISVVDGSRHEFGRCAHRRIHVLLKRPIHFVAAVRHVQMPFQFAFGQLLSKCGRRGTRSLEPPIVLWFAFDWMILFAKP